MIGHGVQSRLWRGERWVMGRMGSVQAWIYMVFGKLYGEDAAK